MVLHLLGKKSWNVYNQDNIARVQRDEAEAAKHERERAHLEQSHDAERRMSILRGQKPLDSAPTQLDEDGQQREDHRHGEPRERHIKVKRRRIAGEDDTDRDIRIARELAASEGAGKEKDSKVRSSDAALLDAQGHTILFPIEREKGQAERKPSRNGKAPWYTSSTGNLASTDITVSKDVWGNEDPRRQQRQQRRQLSDDPLMAIKRGVGQLRKAERARKMIEEERRQELESLKRADHESHRSRRRRRSASPDKPRSRDADADRSRHRHRHGSRHRHHNEHNHRHREHDRTSRHTSSSHHHSDRHRSDR